MNNYDVCDTHLNYKIYYHLNHDGVVVSEQTSVNLKQTPPDHKKCRKGLCERYGCNIPLDRFVMDATEMSTCCNQQVTSDIGKLLTYDDVGDLKLHICLPPSLGHNSATPMSPLNWNPTITSKPSEKDSLTCLEWKNTLNVLYDSDSELYPSSKPAGSHQVVLDIENRGFNRTETADLETVPPIVCVEEDVVVVVEAPFVEQYCAQLVDLP